LEWQKKLGVDTKELSISSSQVAEQVLEATVALCNSCEVGVVVIDSVASLIPQGQLEGKTADKLFGAKGRVADLAGVMGQAVRQIAGAAARGNTLVIFVNQLRDLPGMMWGDTETTPGGRALKFHASVRLRVRRQKDILDGKKVIGNYSAVELVKSKVSPRGRKTGVDCPYIPIYYDARQVDEFESLLVNGLELGLVVRNGAYYTTTIGGMDITGAGKEAFKGNLSAMCGLEAFRQTVVKQVGIGGSSGVSDSAEWENEAE
jgi:recombination protein RecA